MTSKRKRLKRTTAWTALLLAAAVLLNPAFAREKLDDADITSAIDTELVLTEAVPSHRIDVSTKDGIVKLDGSVYNILAKERATEVAESIKGVRSVVNTIEVKPVDRDDADIRSDIVTALATDPAADSYEVTVKVKDGTATLSGTVDSYKEKELSAEVAKGVKGVKAIENKIMVSYKTKRKDSEIKPEIERLLESDVRIDDWGITVEVDDGDVTLSGTVGSAAEKSLAESTAWVAGVKSVNSDDLEVKWWARDDKQRKKAYIAKSDKEIEDAVHDALMQDPRVWSFNVAADCDGGMVELHGIVDNLKAKKAAETDARHTVGVWNVRNHLKVRPEPYVSDSDIIKNVKSALERDPYVDRHELSVSSYNGKVFLYGTVDSDFEKEQAEDVAWRSKGVVNVQNNIVISAEWPLKTDWEIENDIQDQFYWSPYVDSEDVTVNVELGVATLTGTVDSWREYREAAENAYEGGATEVVNRLRVL